jgi:hypothetical protein
MKMRLMRFGRKFFFITLCVEGSVADAGAIFRQNCLSMNDMAAAICAAVAQRTIITAPLGGGSKTRLW